MPKVSLISVNYRQAEVTEDFLKSLKALSFRDFELILVDNAPTEPLEDLLGERYPWVRFVTCSDNLGFAGGNNVGIAHATGDFLFFVNNDTELVEGCIPMLVDFLEKNPKAGMVCPMIVYNEPNENGEEIIQYLGMTRLDALTGRNVQTDKFEINRGQFSEPRKTGYAHGAAFMIPAKMVDVVGGMPEEYFLYYEEMDWSHQILEAGYEVWVEPRTKIYHKESITTSKMGSLKTYFTNRNRILFMRRNGSFFGKIGFYLFLFLITVPKNTIGFLLKREFENLKAFWSSVWWNFFPNDTHPFEQLAAKKSSRNLNSTEVSV